MIEQSFAFADIPRIFTLVFLEILLSADNAIVLGVLSRSLPPHLRKKALFIGVASAFVLRAGALLGVALLI
jgi:predicted tellurium resistance membrane protein TerC